MATNKNNNGCKITLHWLNASRAQRIVWLLEELNLEYEIKTYKRNKIGLAPKELFEVHPLGKSPVVSIKPPGADKEIVLAESGTIVEYLCDYFGKHLIPKRFPEGKDGQIGEETKEWMKYRFYMHYTEGSLQPNLLIALLVYNIEKAPVPFFIKPIIWKLAGNIRSVFLNQAIETHYGFVEQQLAASGGDYICGKELTAADFLLVFPLWGGQMRCGLTQEKYPNVYAYVDRLYNRKAYKDGITKIETVTGEPYDPSL